MKILIAATSLNNALGKDNKIIWHLPDDFKRFKELTSGHYIIMGRKTFESFPKPLPNRTHVVITRQKNYNPEGCIVVNSIEEAFSICPKNEDSFLIGGAEIYELGLPYVDKIELTLINDNFEADAFLPKIDFSKWELIQEENHPKDEKHAHEFSFQTYLKR
jgi:dihydrofolate reductase